MKDFEPSEIIVEAGSEPSPIYRNLRKALPHVPFTFVNNVEAPGSALFAASLNFHGVEIA